MKLTGLHLLLTYQCTLECDHCFVWSSPWQTGTMTLQQVRQILRQGQDLGTVKEIYFEGGEPFLCYPILVKGVEEAAEAGFRVGLVSNSFWATSVEDAIEWLKPFTGKLVDLSVSSDSYHWDEQYAQKVKNAQEAAAYLHIPIGTITVAQPETVDAAAAIGQLPQSESRVMYRGRAAEKLSGRAAKHPWATFTACPYENLRDPGRVHVDPFGYLHLCQGITLGNLFETPLAALWATFDPDSHPIAGPLLAGGPAELARRYDVSLDAGYADACHLCYTTREKLRARFPAILTPDQMYGLEAG
ncbi:MAG: radical SAM protein [Anaerolineae bacterium]|nr:radical SAM protein [Anaerolineae bacterium]